MPKRIKSIQEGFSAKKMKGKLKKQGDDEPMHHRLMFDNLNVSDSPQIKPSKQQESSDEETEEAVLQRKLKESKFASDMESVGF
mmetsp:Transcript_25614/g.39415  ORF Transcript_25614/g.39415 Transcript_25614/m.39415 type:complete len:84 (+) Transcript_25614:386-637(+)